MEAKDTVMLLGMITVDGLAVVWVLTMMMELLQGQQLLACLLVWAQTVCG